MYLARHTAITKSRKYFINKLVKQYDKEEKTWLRRILESDRYEVEPYKDTPFRVGFGCGFIEFDYHTLKITNIQHTDERITFDTVGSNKPSTWKKRHWRNVVVNDTHIRLAVVMSSNQLIRYDTWYEI